MSGEAKDLLRHLLKVSPVERFSATDVLNHAWIKSGNVSSRPLSVAVVGGLTKIQESRTRFRTAVQSIIATMKLGKLRNLSLSAGGSGGSGAGDDADASVASGSTAASSAAAASASGAGASI